MDILSGIVCVKSGKQIGTGFVVSKDGLIVTCAHVLGEPPPTQATVVFPSNGEQREAVVIAQAWRSPAAEDVAFLRVAGPLPTGIHALPVGDSQGSEGHKFTTVGYPNIREMKEIRGGGDIVGLIQNEAGHALLQLRSGEITEGFSGGPIWDEQRRRVVGMANSVISEDRLGKLGMTAFATPIEVLREIHALPKASELSPNGKQNVAFNVFMSYARKDRDRALCDELVGHLKNLQKQGQIKAWHDGDIVAGSEWRKQIQEHLNSADIILLLISADFMASDFCYSVEMKRAIERHKAGEACVLPILLRPTDWEGAPFEELKMLPDGAKPVINWSNRDAAWLNVVQGIRGAIKELKENP